MVFSDAPERAKGFKATENTCHWPMAGVLDGLVVVVSRPTFVVPHGRIVPLELDGYWFIPMTDSLREELGDAGKGRAEAAGFMELTESVASFGAGLSRVGPTLYLHSEFHGGEGTHEVLGWRDGEVTFGPLFTRTPRESAEVWYEVADGPDMAINAGLRWLGGSADSSIDEFCSVGLDRYRWTDDWANSPL